MKTKLLIITIILMFSFSVHVFLHDNNNFVYALSCKPINITESLDNANVVFFGKVISKEYVPSDRDNKRQDAIVQFSVIEDFKGITGPKISVVSGEWLWGFNFTKGVEYVVFADKNGEMLHVQDCAPTGTLDFIDIDQIRHEAQNMLHHHYNSSSQEFQSTKYSVKKNLRFYLNQIKNLVDASNQKVQSNYTYVAGQARMTVVEHSNDHIVIRTISSIPQES